MRQDQIQLPVQVIKYTKDRAEYATDFSRSKNTFRQYEFYS